MLTFISLHALCVCMWVNKQNIQNRNVCLLSNMRFNTAAGSGLSLIPRLSMILLCEDICSLWQDYRTPLLCRWRAVVPPNQIHAPHWPRPVSTYYLFYPCAELSHIMHKIHYQMCTYSTCFDHSGGSLKVMNIQLVKIVHIMIMLKRVKQQVKENVCNMSNHKHHKVLNIYSC